jgi:hypothetical protein
MNSYAGGVAPFWSAILTFHSLDRGGQLFSTSPEVFRMQVGALLEARIPIVPLEQNSASRRRGRFSNSEVDQNAIAPRALPPASSTLPVERNWRWSVKTPILSTCRASSNFIFAAGFGSPGPPGR